jgi:hypothetical protein
MTTSLTLITLCDTLTGRSVTCPDVDIERSLLDSGWFVDPSPEIRDAIRRLHYAVVTGQPWQRFGEDLGIAVAFE